LDGIIDKSLSSPVFEGVWPRTAEIEEATKIITHNTYFFMIFTLKIKAPINKPLLGL
jgi:hypothetical protein